MLRQKETLGPVLVERQRRSQNQGEIPAWITVSSLGMSVV
jgi:hypothetical protein